MPDGGFVGSSAAADFLFNPGFGRILGRTGADHQESAAADGDKPGTFDLGRVAIEASPIADGMRPATGAVIGFGEAHLDPGTRALHAGVNCLPLPKSLGVSWIVPVNLSPCSISTATKCSFRPAA